MSCSFHGSCRIPFLVIAFNAISTRPCRICFLIWPLFRCWRIWHLGLDTWHCHHGLLMSCGPCIGFVKVRYARVYGYLLMNVAINLSQKVNLPTTSWVPFVIHCCWFLTIHGVSLMVNTTPTRVPVRMTKCLPLRHVVIGVKKCYVNLLLLNVGGFWSC